MSGPNPGGVPSAVVVLAGRAGGTTHREVELLDSLPPELCLIGGLAVMCRVGTPHRATVDLDALTTDLDGAHDSILSLAVTSSGGGQYRFAGDLDLDVIEVAPVGADQVVADLDDQPTDLELNAIAHAFAHGTAMPVDVVAVDETDRAVLATATRRQVATTEGLIAMKVTAAPLRASSKPEKRASDLYDLGRLLVDGNPDADELGQVPDVLRHAIRSRLDDWFVDDTGRARTLRLVRRFDEPRLDLDEVADAVADLDAAAAEQPRHR